MTVRTRHIRLGTMVTPLARRRPWKVARETVTLDHLSGGRLILGVGVGDLADPTFERFGEETNARRRAQMPRRGPARRMLRWDGFCPYKSGPGEPWEDLNADDVRAICAAAGERPGAAPFEISVGGRRRQPDWDADRAHIQSVAEAGATWWTEHVPPDDVATMRAAIELGPLRVG